MFRKIRIAVLVYVLLFVAVGNYLTASRSTDWQETLWVDVYPVNADSDPTTQAYLDTIDTAAFASIEDFFAGEARSFGVALPRPFRVGLAGQLDAAPPAPPASSSALATLWWSLRMRWFVTKLHWTDDRPIPDITLFLLYHSPDTAVALDRSTALRKGMVALANVFATREMAGANQVIVAHELLHTLGATDKYDLRTTLPLFPHGFANPERSPLYPQSRAEIMGGRIPVSANEAVIPRQLSRVVVGPATAYEIGWVDAAPHLASR